MPEPPSVAALPPTESEDLAAFVDIEMQDIFLEEAAEVLAAGHVAVTALQQDDSDAKQMLVLRRAFHTLKGSARMVGLDAFGEGAWACEQLYNARLGAAAPQADAALLGFTSSALDFLAGWCEQIAGHASGQFQPDPLRRGADALRLPSEVLTTVPELAPPESALPTAPVPLPMESEVGPEIEPLKELV
ncbi:Hpt domain-containing protein, partial [Roseateles sp. GG27B]